jgi:hypothetical protein
MTAIVQQTRLVAGGDVVRDGIGREVRYVHRHEGGGRRAEWDGKKRTESMDFVALAGRSPGEK